MTAHLRVATCQVLKAIRNKWLPCWTADLEYIKQSKKKGGGGRREDKQPKERMWHCYTP